jgi:hypothetical protein
MYAVLVVIGGHVYHVPLWVPMAAIVYKGGTFSVRWGKTLVTVKRGHK